jgi:glycosyltransferase involved in cell wall biosynthesis
VPRQGNGEVRISLVETIDLPRLRIAQVAPPYERVPPRGYGGTERIVDELSRELARRGHTVTLFASGDSESPGELVATLPTALRDTGSESEAARAYMRTVELVLEHEDRFDLIHSHLDFWSLPLARAAAKPVVVTFHGRLDVPLAAEALRDQPATPVALSRGHAAQCPGIPWRVVYNGLSLDRMPFEPEPGEDLCFVGRIAPEKGVLDAIEIARLSGRRLRIAAKEPFLEREKQYYTEVFAPARGRADVVEVGELGAAERDALMAASYATLMPSDWPEPFGLTAIESLACGTPVIARPVGALPEIIRDGRDGFLGADAEAMAASLAGIARLDRAAIRRDVLDRFSASRMADGYEEIYRSVLPQRETTRIPPARVARVQ